MAEELLRKGGKGSVKVTVGDVNQNGRVDLTLEVVGTLPLFGTVKLMDCTVDVPEADVPQALAILNSLAVPLVSGGIGAVVANAPGALKGILPR